MSNTFSPLLFPIELLDFLGLSKDKSIQSLFKCSSYLLLLCCFSCANSSCFRFLYNKFTFLRKVFTSKQKSNNLLTLVISYSLALLSPIIRIAVQVKRLCFSLIKKEKEKRPHCLNSILSGPWL